MKLEGKAPLGPPYIQNEPEYLKVAHETMIDAQLKCKKQSDELNVILILFSYIHLSL